jgi:hypothetical protein
MKKLHWLLLVFSIMFMVACGSSYEKNPHLSKINDDVSAAKMKIKEKSYSGFTYDSKVEEKTYGDEEEKLVDDILHIKYNYLPIYQIIFGISAQLDSPCNVSILYNEYTQMGTVHFIWDTEGNMVTLSIPITKRNKKYLIMELSEVASSTMKNIDNKKDLSLEEKEKVKAVGYKQAWIPTLYTTFNGEGKEFSLENIKSLNEIRDLVKILKSSNTKNIFEFVEGKYEISEYASFEFLKEIMKANESYMLPFAHMAAPSIESVSDGIYFKLGADRAIIDAAAGNMIGAYLSVTYYKNDKQLAVLYFMLDEELVGTQDVRLEFSNGKELDSLDVIRYAQE